MSERQSTLFELPPPAIASAEIDGSVATLADRLPGPIRLGGMSWVYPGWRGIVYGARVSEEAMAKHGLSAYAKHPLLRAVEIDRSYYDPLPAESFAAFAEQVPDDFRFIVKAHEHATVAQFPMHARYGNLRGTVNARYLDASYVAERVVAPALRGLGSKLALVLFQFPPHDPDPGAFADQLHDFLARLPRSVRYAVEIRDAHLLTRAYGRVLAATGVVHCHNAWTGMPDVIEQARALPRESRRPLFVRWLASHGDSYEDARKRFAPFERIVTEDVTTREAIARLAAKAAQSHVDSFVLVSNHAEGCAPLSLLSLAKAVQSMHS